ncbi:Unknown protein [Striga hermonthica]|uniref:Late embryogenesis abundant protein n=1 Tax=Striga hermonthica TaxID=68872 RepID=A0A9N7N849_STRHE|nr:Unknown protein [Striga hermonthica]
MAANLQSRGFVSFGKRLVGQIHPRRSIHNSIYDKNPDENTHSTVVPDHVMPPRADEYWAPHPKTGVFGPSSNDKPDLDHDSGPNSVASDESALEQRAFFRPNEDLEKPPVQP